MDFGRLSANRSATIPAGGPLAGVTAGFPWRVELFEKTPSHSVWYFERFVNAFGETRAQDRPPLLIRASILILNRTEICTATPRARLTELVRVIAHVLIRTETCTARSRASLSEELVRNRVHDINA